MQFIKILNSAVYAVTYISCYFVGYARDEVLGRNCRFLSGVDTDSSTLYQVSFVVIGSLCNASGKVLLYAMFLNLVLFQLDLLLD